MNYLIRYFILAFILSVNLFFIHPLKALEIRYIPGLIDPLQSASEEELLSSTVWDRYTCQVLRHGNSGNGSLRHLIDLANLGTNCSHNIFFEELSGTLTISLSQNIELQTEDLFISGADFSRRGMGQRSLGIVIDARALGDRCVFTVAHPSRNVMSHLKFLMNGNPGKAICNQDGLSLISADSAAYDPRYSSIEVCVGATCFTTPSIPNINPSVSTPTNPMTGAGMSSEIPERMDPRQESEEEGEGERSRSPNYSRLGTCSLHQNEHQSLLFISPFLLILVFVQVRLKLNKLPKTPFTK